MDASTPGAALGAFERSLSRRPLTRLDRPVAPAAVVTSHFGSTAASQRGAGYPSPVIGVVAVTAAASYWGLTNGKHYMVGEAAVGWTLPTRSAS